MAENFTTNLIENTAIHTGDALNTTTYTVLDMVELLAHHFGDGIVYLRTGEQSSLYSIAVENGLINEEGYLTRMGRQFLAQHSGKSC